MQNIVGKKKSCSGQNAVTAFLSFLAYSLLCSVHLVSRPGTLLGYEPSVAEMA